IPTTPARPVAAALTTGMFGLAGGVLAGAAVGTVHLVRNRGPPAERNATTPTVAGLAARRWMDRVVIGAPLLRVPVVQRPALITLFGAGLIGLPLMLFGVPLAGTVTAGASVVAASSVLGGLLQAALARSARAATAGYRPRPTYRPRGLRGVLMTASPALSTAVWLALTGHALLGPVALLGGAFLAATAIVAIQASATPGAPRGSPVPARAAKPKPTQSGRARRVALGAAAVALLGVMGLSVVGGLAELPSAPGRAPHSVVRFDPTRSVDPSISQSVELAGMVLEVPAQTRPYVDSAPQDTTARLADGLDTTVTALRALNPALPASDDQVIPRHTRVFIPNGSGTTWTVQPNGDNLSWIAERFDLHDWTVVAKANQDKLAGRDPNLIYPDEHFAVPGPPRTG
ncbi:MAG: LysM peptidoglycan-binding domain-containing protein, partial [Actinomycetes bacterium]